LLGLGEEDTISKNKETINNPAIAAPIIIRVLCISFYCPAVQLAREAPFTFKYDCLDAFGWAEVALDCKVHAYSILQATRHGD
jgi:hypothetical protein